MDFGIYYIGMNKRAVSKKYVANKKSHTPSEYKMTKHLESIIKATNLEKKSDKSPTFKNSKDAIRWLNSIK